MKFAFPSILFTTIALAAWTATPAFSAKVEASTTINDKDTKIHEAGDDYAFTSKDDLNLAVTFYCHDPDAWEDNYFFHTYGPIESWNVSQITDMSFLFAYKGDGSTDFTKWDCNPDISNWDVSNVVNFSSMFEYTYTFNQNIGEWDVSSGVYFDYMFYLANSFNQDISSWDVSEGEYFDSMFNGAHKFDQDLCGWQISSDVYLGGFCIDAVSCGDCFSSILSTN